VNGFQPPCVWSQTFTFQIMHLSADPAHVFLFDTATGARLR